MAKISLILQNSLNGIDPNHKKRFKKHITHLENRDSNFLGDNDQPAAGRKQINGLEIEILGKEKVGLFEKQNYLRRNGTLVIFE
jgi:hypothetical protein